MVSLRLSIPWVLNILWVLNMNDGYGKEFPLHRFARLHDYTELLFKRSADSYLH